MAAAGTAGAACCVAAAGAAATPAAVAAVAPVAAGVLTDAGGVVAGAAAAGAGAAAGRAAAPGAAVVAAAGAAAVAAAGAVAAAAGRAAPVPAALACAGAAAAAAAGVAGRCVLAGAGALPRRGRSSCIMIHLSGLSARRRVRSETDSWLLPWALPLLGAGWAVWAREVACAPSSAHRAAARAVKRIALMEATDPVFGAAPFSSGWACLVCALNEYVTES